MANKKKIINDPIYGFITIPSDLIFDIIEHPYFQRLRRIKQLGLADYTYPGALHTRFHHALGAMHLMGLAIENLKNKGNVITNEETEAVQIAILLHDIGHGPFSHALEFTLLQDTTHEQLTQIIFHKLNHHFDNRLDLAIQIFEDKYPRKFLYQLVSSQLDIDRLDYLQRDCFFTGVSEGTIGADRIIKMLELVDDKIVVEEKAIYSIENFLSARRLMYWQVYLHKTVVSAEQMIVQIIKRARYLSRYDKSILTTDSLKLFLQEEIDYEKFKNDPLYLEAFAKLDDYDVWSSIKLWSSSKDRVLNFLCNNLLNRKLFKIQIGKQPTEKTFVDIQKQYLAENFNWTPEEINFLIVSGTISNAAYNSGNHQINILMRSGKVVEIGEATDLPNIKALNQIVTKHYTCWPKYAIPS